MTSVLTATVLSLLVQVPDAAPATANHPQRLHGVVTSVSGNTFTLRVGKRKDPTAHEVTVQMNANTKFVAVANGSRTPASSASLTVKSHVLVIMQDANGGNTARVVAIVQRKGRKGP